MVSSFKEPLIKQKTRLLDDALVRLGTTTYIRIYVNPMNLHMKLRTFGLQKLLQSSSRRKDP